VEPDGASGELRPVERIDWTDAAQLGRWVERKEPVILRGLAIDQAAWTPEQIAKRCGQLRVHVCTHTAATEHDPMGYIEQVTIAEYFERHFGAAKAVRIFGAALAQMEGKDDICQRVGLDSVGTLGLAQARSLFYASATGGVVPMHFDIDFAHIFMIQLHGSRHVRLFAPSQSRNLYKIPFRPVPMVPLDELTPERFPRRRKLQGYQCQIMAGEALYMPPRYWHFVEYREPACGISVRYRKAGKEGQALAWYGKKVAMLDERIRKSAVGGAWANLMKGMARI